MILVKQGLYALAASLVLPNKPVTIRGSAAGSAFFGAAGTTIDLGANAFPAFTAPVGVTQNFLIESIQVLGTFVAGQHLYSDLGGSGVTFRDMQISGIDRIFDSQVGMSATIEDSISFTANTLMDGAGASASVLAATNCLLYLNGPVGIGGPPTVDLTNNFMNSFGTFSVDVNLLSTIVETRWASANILVSGTQCRFSAMEMFGGSLTLPSTNTMISGCIFDSMAVGVAVTGTRNSVVGARFSAVPVPISEAGAADFNLYDAINGFAGSVVIGGGSVVGTVVP